MESFLTDICLDESDFEPRGDNDDQNVNKIVKKISRVEILEKRKRRKIEKKEKKKRRRTKNKNKLTDDPAPMKQVIKRVNHFIAIQVTNLQIKEQVRLIQEKILSTPCTIKSRGNKDKKMNSNEDDISTGDTGAIFKDAMERQETLHFTLNVIGLYNDEETNKAKEAVQTCWEKHRLTFQENPINLDIGGLDHFGHKVIFAKIQNDDHIQRLNSLSHDLRKEFKKMDILQDLTPFKAHMTIAKLSKSRTLFKQRIRSFPPEIWSEFQSHSFGQQPIQSLQLLAMARDPTTNYYKIVSELPLVSSCLSSSTDENLTEDVTMS